MKCLYFFGQQRIEGMRFANRGHLANIMHWGCRHHTCAVTISSSLRTRVVNNVEWYRHSAMYCILSSVLILTSSIHPWGWSNDERMAPHCLKSVFIGLHIPSDLKISLGLWKKSFSCHCTLYNPLHPFSRQCTDTLSHHVFGSEGILFALLQ